MSDESREAPMTDAQQHASDQRAEMRHKVYVSVIAVDGDAVDRKAISGNLSRSGLFVATPNIVALGSEIEVRFRLPNKDDPITATAEVVWTNEEKDFDEGKLPGYGVEFIELDEQHQRELDEYMDHFELKHSEG